MRFGTGFLIWMTLGFVAPPDEGREILERALEAHGGLGSFRAVRDWHIVAERRLETGDVRRETYQELFLRDGSSVLTLLIKIRDRERLVFGHDGEKGFAFVDGRRREDPGAAGEAFYRAHGEYYLRAIPFKWADPGVRVSHAGRERGESGRELVLLRIEAAEGAGPAWRDVWTAAFDSETMRLSEARLRHHRALETWMDPPSDGVVEITYRYSDYRTVGGLSIPFRLEYVSGGAKTGENVIQRIELDAGLTRGDFAPERFDEESDPE